MRAAGLKFVGDNEGTRPESRTFGRSQGGKLSA